MADMAAVAHERGGDPNAVSIVHALRVATVVSVVPFLVVAFGERGASAPAEAAAWHNPLLLGFMLALAYLVARLLKPTPLPNPWLVGPMLLGAAFAASGVPLIAVPPILIVLAQVLIGAWLGCQFKRDILVTLPRVAAAGFAVSLFMIAAAWLGALVLVETTGLPFSTSFLALAPAAVTEMVITAKAMNVDAELVTAFHVMRIAVISSTVLLVYRLFRLIARVGHGSGV
jgi:membrane AbrB-like protein